MANIETVVRSQESVLATNKVIRNTYTLLSMTLLFSALCAAVAVVMKMPPLGIIVTLVGYFGLLFLTAKFRDSALGLAFVFALTGFMGYTLGPILNAYLAVPNGSQVVMTAMGATGAIFLAGDPDSGRDVVIKMVSSAVPNAEEKVRRLFLEMAEAVRSVAVEAVPPPTDEQWNRGRIVSLVGRVIPPGSGLVLVIDQFEELFSLCPSELERERFMDALLALAADPDGRTRIVLTLRADYYGLPLEYRPFGDVLRTGVVSLTLPGPEQLSEAITGPAAVAGLRVDADLAADLVADAVAEPGGLPLMEYALTRLADRQSDGRLTLAAYRQMGGLADALGTWPEGLFQSLDEPSRNHADGRPAAGHL